MERILKILVIGIFAFLLILWISTLFTTCNEEKNQDITETEQLADSLEINEEVDLDEDIFSDTQNEENNSSTTTNTTPSGEKEDLDDYIDYSGDVKEDEPSPQSKPKVKAPTNTNKTKPSKRATTSSSGSYLVVAGSYLVKDNASKMKDKLYNLGYNSEIVNFDLSQYYSVLAGRFSSRSDAKSAVTILKRNGIDSYVHTKK